MGREISLFSDFYQGENRITNYCGLILKMVYQENPIAFQEIIITLLGDANKEFNVLPIFHQQETKKAEENSKSVPDLVLQQSSFNIYFEVKTTDWFYENQVTRHLSNLINEFNNSDNKILFLLTSEFNNDIKNRLKGSFSKASQKETILQIITFEEFLSAVQDVADRYIEKSSYVFSVIPEFEDFLNRNWLLPSWKHTIDVVPCGSTQNEIRNGMYICPAMSGAYSHTRAKFFGAYWNKKVEYVSEISGIVIAQKEDNGSVSYNIQWSNLENQDETKRLIEEAKIRFQTVEAWRRDELNSTNLRIFILDNMQKTSIEKKSKGGIRGKIYWCDITSDTVEDLIKELENRTW